MIMMLSDGSTIIEFNSAWTQVLCKWCFGQKMTQSEHYTVAHEHADCVLPSDLLVMFHMRFQQDFGRSNCEHSCRPIISSTGNTPVVLCRIHLYENRWNRWNMLFFQKFYLPLLKKSYIVSSSPWWWILFKWINDISLCKMTISVRLTTELK